MLQVDFNDGRYQIVERITKCCTAYGDVKSIRMFLESTSTAVIEMSTIEQTEKLASGLGGRLVGPTVFIELTHRARRPMADVPEMALAS